MTDDHSPTPITILIADDQEYLREGIRGILAGQPGMSVVGAAKDGTEALQMTLDLKPSLLLLDIHMPGMNGIDVAKQVRLKQPAIAQLVEDTIMHFDARRYCLLAWCIMPNHIHVVVEPTDGNRIGAIVHSWKSFSAKQANHSRPQWRVLASGLFRQVHSRRRSPHAHY